MADREWRRLFLLDFILIAVPGTGEGFCLASLLPRPLLPSSVLFVVAIPALAVVYRWGTRKMDEIARNARRSSALPLAKTK